MTLLAPPLQRSSRTVWPGSGAPVRTRSPPTATASGFCSDSCTSKPARHLRSWGWKTSAHTGSPRSSRISNPTGQRVCTRNARRTAIHSFLRLASLKVPVQAELIARVLTSPKSVSTAADQLSRQAEIVSLPAAPDRSTWTVPRDHALLLLAVQTGLRLSGLIGLRGQAPASTSPWFRCEGKGRKERCTPLTRQTVQVLRIWLREQGGDPTSPLFPSRSGRHLTRGAIWRRVITAPRHHRRAMPLDHDQKHHPARAGSQPARCDSCTPLTRSAPRRSRSGSATKARRDQQVLVADMNSNGAHSTGPRPQTPI